MASKRPPKLDLIPASAFADLSAYALCRLGADTAAADPRFSHAILSLLNPVDAFIPTPRNRHLNAPTPSAFSAALEGGQLGYARLLAARLRPAHSAAELAKAIDLQRRAGFVADPIESTRWIHRSKCSDGQAARTRRWIWARLGSGDKPADFIALEAQSAFSSGRPALGLMLCKELLGHSADDIAKATSIGQDLPLSSSGLKSAQGSEGMVDRSKFRAELEEAQRYNRSESRSVDDPSCPPTTQNFAQASLLSLGAFWRKALASSADPASQALADSLGSTLNALWDKGALSSPRDLLARFSTRPYGQDSAQTRAMARLPDPHLRLALAWRHAAERPLGACGDSTLWEAFIDAHGPLLGASLDPFALSPMGQAPALWSLAGDARLLAWGIELGFNPKPIDYLLAKPGSLGAAFQKPESQRAQLGRPHGPHFWNHALRSPGFHIDKARGPRAKAPVLGHAESQPDSWIRVNLCSLALFMGHDEAARALAGASCSSPDMAIAMKELDSEAQIELATRRLSAFEEHVFSRDVPGAREPKADSPAPTQGAAAPRRILKA